MAGKKIPDNLLVFLGLHAACDKNKETAMGDHVRRSIYQGNLNVMKAAQIIRAPVPANIRMTSYDSQPGTGGVNQYPVIGAPMFKA